MRIVFPYTAIFCTYIFIVLLHNLHNTVHIYCILLSTLSQYHNKKCKRTELDTFKEIYETLKQNSFIRILC